MSFTPNDRSLLSESRKNASSRDRLAGALRRAVSAGRWSAKEAARLLRVTPRGAQSLLNGENAPSFETLVEACRHFDEVWDEMRELCGRAESHSDAEALLDEFARRLRERRS
jgi:transcriptional regulator with XRE-family HTH domain